MKAKNPGLLAVVVLLASLTGAWAFEAVNFGFPGCVPVLNDYDGDGMLDCAVYYANDGGWYILQSSDGTMMVTNWGFPGTTPISRDWTGDGKADFGVYDPAGAMWYFLENRTSNTTGGSVAGYAANGDFANAPTAGGNDAIAMGNDAVVNGDYAVVSGGDDNEIEADADYGTIGGGRDNEIMRASESATVSGGRGNQIEPYASYATIAGGYINDVFSNADYSVVGGGYNNDIHDNAKYSVIPGGYANSVHGQASWAGGSSADAAHDNTFVWSDGSYGVTNGLLKRLPDLPDPVIPDIPVRPTPPPDFTSTRTNQFAVHASGGLYLAANAGSNGTVNVGERYRDNGILAWARISADGTVNAQFGIEEVEKLGTGEYEVTLAVSTTNVYNQAIMVTPEIDSQPGSTSAMRIASVNQIDEQTLRVYMNRGNGDEVDNDFTLMVTGR